MRRTFLVLFLTLGVFACSNGGRETGPTAALPPESDQAAIEREVEAAYLKSWDVYAAAMLTLDPSGLSASYQGPQLERSRRSIEEQARKNQPAQMAVEHDYEIWILDARTAEIRDTYRNHSVILDAVTRQPAEPDPNNLLTEIYTLEKTDGNWLVTNIARQQ